MRNGRDPNIRRGQGMRGPLGGRSKWPAGCSVAGESVHISNPVLWFVHIFY